MADIVESADVRVIEGGDGVRLGLESGAEFLADNFDGDIAAETGVMRAVDLAHASRSDRREDFVRAEACAGG